MPTATLRIPAKSAQISMGHLGYGVDILAQVRLDTLADALGRMEHDDTDPGERPMNADQCRDALLRELLGGWSPSELVEAKIPGVLQMWDEIQEIRALVGDDGTHGGPAQVLARKLEAQADEIATLRRERDEARAREARLPDGLTIEMLDDRIAEVGKTLDRALAEDESPLAIGLLAMLKSYAIALRQTVTTPTPGAQA